ncbi:MAG: adenylosuccinate synthase [Planctomycetaceae bacterium]
MSGTSVIGLQWGDEAKGKIVDLLTEEHDFVVRYQGGNNAGHTVKFDGETYKLSLLPAGILNNRVVSVIGPGVVINPSAILQELEGIISRRGDVGDRLRISERAHVIMPWHMLEEAAMEKARGDRAIGTTMRGIGTCYRDKVGRSYAIRIGDLIRGSFAGRVARAVEHKNTILKAMDPDVEPLQADAIVAEYTAYGEQLKPYICNTSSLLHKAVAEEKKLLFEGAQGSLLDVDHGTYPFVTSSNSSGAGIHAGSGVPERYITRMIGVVKAYTTRVGGGPFPSELDNEIGQRIRDAGNEYGTVTGRPRRCGWFDAVAAGYSARLCGIDCLTVALLDVLSGFDELQICEAYDINGERTTDFPGHIDDLEMAKPILTTVPGWQEDITGITAYSDLPKNAQNYVETIGRLMGYPVDIVSVGPDRAQTIMRG